MKLRHLRHWRCFLFGHLWVPILSPALIPMFGSGGYRCSRCPFGSGSKKAFLMHIEELQALFDSEKSEDIPIAQVWANLHIGNE